jgi:hypothetical protein
MTEDQIRAILDSPHDPTRVVFDLAGQTVDALELVLEHLRRVPARAMSWKWALIGMHAALQGSFGLVLRRTDGAQLLVPDQERQFWQRVHRECTTGSPEPMGYVTKAGKPQEPQIDWFLNLFEKVHDPDRMKHFSGVPLSPTPEQTERIELLHSHRGILIHFSDTMLVLTVAEMLDVITTGFIIAEILLTKTVGMADGGLSGPLDTIADSVNADRARELIVAIQSELVAVRDRYGLQAPDQSG